MLRFLRIRNLAVIAGAEVEFDSGFNVLTGETGAGKSILVDAIGLLVGGRASSDLVRTGEAQASIEAVFEEGGRELILRREITSQGRSRSYVNGELATAAALRDLSASLVELHGQHEHQALLDPSTHLPALDQYANLGGTAEQVAAQWAAVQRLREQLERSRMDAREKSARLDLIAFQLGEIKNASPKPGEDDELESTRRVLASAERVQRLCEESYLALYDSDQAVLTGLGTVWKRVGELAALDPRFSAHLEARDGIKSQLEDLAFFLRSYADGVDASPSRLQQVDERLVLLDRLKKRYGPTLADVIARGASLQHEQALLTGDSQSSDQLQEALAAATDKYLASARTLSAARRTAAVALARQMEALLAELAMARTRFEVRFNPDPLPEPAWGERGIDLAEFYVSPNPGEDLRPLARIVSGGELSRVMLALKTLTASDHPGKTLIFDEVDAGIGGRVADVVGSRLEQLGSRFQVLCITHLPQIAARGTTQYRIEKQVRAGRTSTTVARLQDEERPDEIARMIGGVNVSEAARRHACELLAARNQGESERRKRKSSKSSGNRG